MAGLTTQGSSAGTPAPPPLAPIPPVPSRAGAATGATAVGQGVSDAPVAPGQASQESGTETIIVQPPPYRDQRNNDIPAEVIPLVGMVMGTAVAIALGYPIVRMITRFIERRTDKAYVKGANVEAQLRALQESVDTMAIEIERIGESQRYQAKLLAERKPGTLPPG